LGHVVTVSVTGSGTVTYTGATGWNTVFRQTHPFVQAQEAWMSYNPTDTTADNFSDLASLEDYRASDGKFTLKITWPARDGENFNMWRQSSNPVSQETGGVTGYVGVEIAFTDNMWGGLERWPGGAAFLDGSVNTGYWFYAVGAASVWSGGIPGANEAESVVELHAFAGEDYVGRTATCQADGSFSTVSCDANQCAATEAANSDKAATGSIMGVTGDTVDVSCDAGYPGGGTVTCLTTGMFSIVSCDANACVPTEVANSGKAATGSITGVTNAQVQVACDAGYTGGGTATCLADGSFSTVTCAANQCTATEVVNSDKAVSGSIMGVTGDEVDVTCDAGYPGGGTVTCLTTGSFSIVTCDANTCPTTEVADSDKAATGSIMGVTGDVVSVTCDAGFSGGGTAICETDGTFTKSGTLATVCRGAWTHGSRLPDDDTCHTHTHQTRC
jgi:hypothetical protein